MSIVVDSAGIAYEGPREDRWVPDRFWYFGVFEWALSFADHDVILDHGRIDSGNNQDVSMWVQFDSESQELEPSRVRYDEDAAHLVASWGCDRVASELGMLATQWWRWSGAPSVPASATVGESPDGSNAVIMALPGTDNPEQDADVLWRLYEWWGANLTSTLDRPILLTIEYSDPHADV